MKEKIKGFFENTKVFFKKYWYLFAAGLVLVFLVFILKTGDGQKLYEDLMKRYHELLDRRDKQVEHLEDIRHSQVSKDRQIEEKYEQVVEQIRTEHSGQLDIIEATQELEIKAIIAETKDDPNKMAEKINEYFGLPIYKGNSDDQN